MRRFETDSLRDWSAFGEGDFVVEGFAEKEMDVLGHDDVAENFEVIAFAGEFQGVEEDVFRGRGGEVGFAR